MSLSYKDMDSTTAFPTHQKKKRIEWMVRPAQPSDKEQVGKLLWKSYSHLLKKDYNDDLLQKALPMITVARDELLTCGTWYVVETPSPEAAAEADTDIATSINRPTIVGCGGFTLHSPNDSTKSTEDDDKQGGGGVDNDTRNGDTTAASNTTTTTTTTNTTSRDVIPHLRHFATDPDFARRGIARAIWDRTWEDLSRYYDTCYSLSDTTTTTIPPFRQRPNNITMEVFSTLTAESFYESLGFRTIEHVSIALGEDCQFPALLMRRENTAGDEV